MSSARAALWLNEEGFEVHVLQDGLGAWQEAGCPTVAIDLEGLPAFEPKARGADASESAQSDATHHTSAFLPGLVENYVNKHTLPMRRDLTVLFVDIADSTRTIVERTPADALAFVQRFMGIVTEVALNYCGDVKDYEGDGALLYFESVGEAAQAAFAIRQALAGEQGDGSDRLRARLSLDTGSTVIGVIGTPLRRSVALIGESINLAARLLKQIPPDGIIATEAVVERLRVEAPALAETFSLLNEPMTLKGFEDKKVIAYRAS
jgi:class 3 adenylate cyclase